MAQNFFDVLRSCQRGATLEQMNDMLAELRQSVMESRGAGSISLTLTMKPDSDNSVELDTKVSVKKPSIKRGKTIFFVAPDGSLVRNDPRQAEMPLRAVPTAIPAAIPAVQVPPRPAIAVLAAPVTIEVSKEVATA